MTKILLLVALLSVISCQNKRKTCQFQGVEVSCGALHAQEQLIQAQKEAQIKKQRDVEAEAKKEAEAHAQEKPTAEATPATKPKPASHKPKKPRKPKPKPLNDSVLFTAPEVDDNSFSLDLEVKRDKDSIEILENKSDSLVFDTDNGQYECDLHVNSGDKITYVEVADIIKLTNGDKTLLFLRKDGINGMVRGTWIHKMNIKEGSYEVILSIKDDKKINLTKKCNIF
jgi:hypothetical protein